MEDKDTPPIQPEVPKDEQVLDADGQYRRDLLKSGALFTTSAIAAAATSDLNTRGRDSVLSGIWRFFAGDRPKRNIPSPVDDFPTLITEKSNITTATRVPSVQATPTIAPTKEAVVDISKLSGTDLLNYTLGLELDFDPRIAAEKVVASKAKTLSEIDQALWVVANPNTRAELLKKRYLLRMNRLDKELTPISKEQLDWCKKEKIHPETLGIVLDNQKRAKEIISDLLKYNSQQTEVLISLEDRITKTDDPEQKKILQQRIAETKSIMFRPDILYQKRRKQIPDNFVASASLIMINPGGLAKLLVTETGGVLDQGMYMGFSHIGNGPAADNINPEVFPDAISALEVISHRVSRLSGLKFTINSITGSLRGDAQENKSGGAIASQIMPDGMVDLLSQLSNPNMETKDTHRNLNPLDINDATVITWLFLAQSTYVGYQDNQELYRYGYLRGENSKKDGISFTKIRRWAIEKWNQHGPQVNSILGSAQSYYDRFPD